MNRVTAAMHNAGATAITKPWPPEIEIEENGTLRLSYGFPDPTLIYQAMERERTSGVPTIVAETTDAERLEWLATSGRWLQRLGSNWRVTPGVPTPGGAPPPPWDAPWFPSMREAIDAARRES